MKDNNQSKQQFTNDYLIKRGLNIHAIFDIDSMPISIYESIRNIIGLKNKQQLIVLGHLGRSLWDNLKQSDVKSNDPVDDFTKTTVQEFFEKNYPHANYQVIYPCDSAIGLQAIGELAGWDYASPFKVGINNKWGSWFAYRAVVIADTDFTLTQPLITHSPCSSCSEKHCIKSCPADALSSGELNLDACVNFRKQTDSTCRNSCIARVSCPVGEEFRYSDEQIQYHYAVSMKTIVEFY